MRYIMVIIFVKNPMTLEIYVVLETYSLDIMTVSCGYTLTDSRFQDVYRGNVKIH